MHLAAVLLLLLAQESDLDRLLKELDHDEIERRDRAAHDLRRLTPEDPAVDRALEALATDGVGETAKRAAQILRLRIAAKFTADPLTLVERLTSTNSGNRHSALAFLAQRGGRAAPLARDLLDDPEDTVRRVALQIIVASDDRAYIPAVRRFVEDPNLAEMALAWLADRKDRSAAPGLRKLCDRYGAAMGGPLAHLAKLRQAEDIERFRAALNEPNQAGLVLRAIRSWDQAKRQLAPEIRMMALEGLPEAVLIAADSRDRTLIPAFTSLGAQEPAAAFALGMMGERDAVPYLLRLVRHRRLNSAIGLLGRLRSREAVWLFRRMLGDPQTTPEPRDRASYARALGDIGGEDAEDLLLKLLEDSSEETRFEAAASLGRLKCKRAIPALVRALDDAVAFPRPVPPPPEAPIFEQYEGKAIATEWRQGREAAAEALTAITGERPEGSIDDRAAAWRARK